MQLQHQIDSNDRWFLIYTKPTGPRPSIQIQCPWYAYYPSPVGTTRHPPNAKPNETSSTK